ncbi:MAG TPA: DNA translocase FtsK [Candidatus Gallacutalibacter stercoravium]|nr:DNA translocase FtsK [Candidatus Gallacutalibacter stercoravium]
MKFVPATKTKKPQHAAGRKKAGGKSQRPTAAKSTRSVSSRATQKSSGTKSSAPPQKGKRQSPAGKRIDSNEAALKSRNQTFAIILFAVAVFLCCVVLIPGESAWNWLHQVILGLFGTSAILWPALLTYISIVTALEKPTHRLTTKIWLMVAIIALFSAAVYLFSNEPGGQGESFWQQLQILYENGIQRRGAGLFSGLLGIPFMAAMGGVGSRIVIILLLFVAVMLLTGTSLIQLFRTVTRPVEAVRSLSHKQRRTDIAQEQRNIQDIDIALDDRELPAHPVVSPNAQDALEHNKKLERLEKAFSAPEPELEPIHVEVAEPETQKEESVTNNAKEEDGGAAQAAAVFAARHREHMIKSDPNQKQPDPQTVPVKPPVAPAGDQAEGGSYRFPPLSLLQPSPDVDEENITEELKANGQMLVDTLKSFGVQTKIVDISRGPAVTRYELQPAAGVKISKITNLADDIALNLAASGVRIEAPIPGKAAVGIEVPNKSVNTVHMRELVESNSFRVAKSKLTVALGRDIAGNVTLADLAKMPHLLIAGSTGSGKSVLINALIVSLLYKSSPDEVRFLMVDPKVVELGIYNGIPHLLVPVVTDPRKAAGALNWAVNEMLKRYKIFAEYNVRDLQAYNHMVSQAKAAAQKAEKLGTPVEENQAAQQEPMPQIVIIIDELADLMMAAPNEVEDSICRLAQMARAAGMHLVIATQRPSVDVITGIIKANIPSRIAFAVSSQVDSRTILDMGGAEKLLGRGDMLFSPIGSSKPIRVQGCWVSEQEIEAIANFVKSAQDPGYDQEVIEEIEKNAVAEKEKGSSGDGEEGETDPMLKDAIKCVVEAGQASTSLLQRRLRLGYARAGRLIDEMEQMGVVGPHEGSKPRQVLMTYQQWLEMNMQGDGAGN